MPIDSDAAFVAEIKSLGERTPVVAEVFLVEVVRRLHSRMPGWDWVGIYFLVDDALVLGPYTGEPTEHSKIPIGVGICGTAIVDEMLLERLAAIVSAHCRTARHQLAAVGASDQTGGLGS